MPTRKSPRKGSLQFWPRKRASKFLPRVNWKHISSGKNLKGFIGYKAGMVSVLVKDNTNDSMTKGKTKIIPATIIECPPIKVYSVRFYKNNEPFMEILSENLDKELKKRIKISKKKISKKIEDVKNFDDIKLIVYSNVKKTSIKKTPDLSEIGLSNAMSLDEKISFVKDKIGKEISIEEIFEKGGLIDVRGLTRGKGLQGPVKRFGITLKSHKSEKGRRNPGSLGPWHPARVTFRVPMAGQLGMFSRITYNNKILEIGKENENLKGLKRYGNVKTNYILVNGSIQGPVKRQLLLTSAMRETKKQKKKNYEIVELMK